MSRIAILVVAVLICSPLGATTSFPTERPDPFSSGVCVGNDAASWGSYIYSWPSKFDQVFWPATDPDFIWICDSGFVAFFGDFDLNENEKARIAEYLADGLSPADEEIGLRDKLKMLETIYALRDQDPHKRNWLLRVLGYHAENHLKDHKLAAQYQELANSQIEAALKGDLEPQKRLEYLFLASRYSLDRGDRTASALYEEDLRTAAAIADEKLRSFAEYLLAALDEYRARFEEAEARE